MKEIIKIVLKATKLEKEFRSTYEAKCKQIKARYSKDIAFEKINLLTAEHQAELQIMADDIDYIFKKKLENRENNLESGITEAYKKERTEISQLLIGIGSKLNKDEVEKLIEPIVEARDLHYLSILSHTVDDRTIRVFEEAKEQIENYNNCTDLEELVKETKKYLNAPSKGLSYTLELIIYRNDIDSYNGLRQ